MANPKIRVAADVSGIEQALEKVQQAVGKAQQSLSGNSLGLDELQSGFDDLVDSAQKLREELEQLNSFNLEGLDADQLTDALEEAAAAAQTLDQAMSALGKQGGATSAVKGARDIADHLARAARAQQLLAQDGIKLSREQVRAAKEQFDTWRQSGARGTAKLRDMHFDDWLGGGWRSYSLDEQEARKRRDQVLQSIGVERARESEGLRRMIGSGRMGGALGGVAGVAGSMLGGGSGGLWGTAGSALGTGLGMGAGMLFGGPIGAVVGMVAGRLLGGLGSAVDGGIQQAGEEGAILSDLRRAIGATGTEFEALRESVRRSTDGLGIAFNEAAVHAREFARASGGETSGLTDALRFGRGYGVDPGQSARFFGEARLRGVAETDRDGRRLAVHIAEAVQRGGMTARMDEVLQALQGYMSQQSRASLTEVNAAGYLSMLSSLGALGFNGLKKDPHAAASMLASADSAIRQGGAFGEASKNFSLGVYQRALPDFSALDMDVLSEQGAFGSVARAFGPDSPAYQTAKLRGDTATMRRYEGYVAAGGDRSLLGMHMDALEREYGGDTAGLVKSMQSHFGMAPSAAMALYQAYKTDPGLGRLEKALSASGIDIGRLDVKQLGAVAEIATADRGGLMREANRQLGLGDALPEQDRRRIQSAAQSGDDEALRQALLSSSALRDTLKDEGERQRQVQADMKNALQRLATELIPATLAIQEGIVELVRMMPGTGNNEYVRRFDQQKFERMQAQQKADEIGGRVQDLDRQAANFKPADPAQLEGMRGSLAQLKRQREAAAARGESTAPWDTSIQQMEQAIRAASPEGLDDIKRQRDQLAGERDRLRETGRLSAPSISSSQPIPSISSASSISSGGKVPDVSSAPGAQDGGATSGSSQPIPSISSASSISSGGKVPDVSSPPGAQDGGVTSGSASSGSGRAPRNLRNNNPGNIVYGEFARKNGATGSDGRFAIFPDAETGSRAMDALLTNYGQRGFDSVREVIGRWAPPSENDTGAYVASVAKRLGVSPDQQLDLSDPSARAALAREIARHEGSAAAYVPPGEGKLPGELVRQQPAGAQPVTVNVGGELKVVDQNNKPTGQVVPLARLDAPRPSAGG